MDKPECSNSMKKKRIRSLNFSKEEELSLVNIISKYKHLIENKATSCITPYQREEAWQEILNSFNSCHPRRSLAQIKSKYDNLKTAARKFAGNNNRAIYGTGGGPPKINDSNPVYEEVLSIINKKTVSGLENKFDDDASDEAKMCEGSLVNIPAEEDFSFEVSDIEITEQEDILTNGERNINNWKSYTPIQLKEKKNEKLIVKGKPSPKVSEKKTLYELKKKYFEQKLTNLVNDDKRKQERHEKEMRLLELEIARKQSHIGE